MKKIIAAIVVLACFTASAAGLTDVNEKVLKAFKETFANATEVVWDEQGDIYQANFKQQAILVRAKFDKEGTLLSTIRYYYEENLPPHIISRLKKKHPGKEVFGVTEVSSENEINYYIKLRDSKFWYTVRSDSNASFELTEKYRKI